jgi:hypothetical protein
MSPLGTSVLVLLFIFGSALVGALLRPRFPSEHVNLETKHLVHSVVGIIGTMTGMVLGLLVASAKSSYDSQRDGLSELAANIVVLDRSLAHYGPETQEARSALRVSVRDMMERIWADESNSSESGKNARYDEVYDRILALEPKNEAERTNHSHALKIVYDTAQMRWRLYARRSSSIPMAFLVLMVLWLAVTFASFGLFAPRHATSFSVLLLGSLVVSSAVFLILELEHPFHGIVHISKQPLQNALAQIGG